VTVDFLTRHCAKTWSWWMLLGALGLIILAAVIGDHLFSDPRCKLHQGKFNSPFGFQFDTNGLDCPLTRSADSPTYRVPIPL
jgi:hypothetical protein